MKAIYQPTGRAREYAEYACNLYTGCGNGCLYCYAPNVLKKSKDYFHANIEPRKGILSAIERESPKYAGKFVHLCFTCDPYGYTAPYQNVTSEAIKILHRAGVGTSILTKLPLKAWGADNDQFISNPNLVKFGTTLTFNNHLNSRVWEPNAELPSHRLDALFEAHQSGIYTWASIEPVVFPDQSLDLIRKSFSFVCEYKIGKLNYHEQASKVDWAAFAKDVISLCDALGVKYTLKYDLATMVR